MRVQTHIHVRTHAHTQGVWFIEDGLKPVLLNLFYEPKYISSNTGVLMELPMGDEPLKKETLGPDVRVRVSLVSLSKLSDEDSSTWVSSH